MMERPLGTLQVDVDELWVYYESIGRPTPTAAPAAVYGQGIPRLLELFDRYGIRATFFVCGRDAAEHPEAVAEMVRRGHEVANHSAVHRNGFARLNRADKRADILTAEAAISRASGVRPIGFKAPGFSFSPDLPELLTELGYRYDSSLLPTPYAPLLRGAQRLLSGGRVDPTHYGRVRYGCAPLRPHRWQPLRSLTRPTSAGPAEADRPGLWEAPVTTMPILRLPMHSTFVLSLGRPLFDLGLLLVKARCLTINYLLHAADVVDAVTDPALASYRFLRQPWAVKRPLYEHMLDTLSNTYRLVPTQELIGSLAAGWQDGACGMMTGA